MTPPPRLSPKADGPWLRPELIASWREIVLVGAVFAGPFVVMSAWLGLHGSGTRYVQFILSNTNLLRNGAFEAASLAGFLWFLSWRGWSSLDFPLRPGGFASLQGIGLFLITEVSNAVTLLLLLGLLFLLQRPADTFLSFVAAHGPHFMPHSVHVGWIVIITSMILNAFVEELIFMGYLFRQIAAKKGPLIALLLTVGLRMGCHTYQDPLHVVVIGFLFLIYGLWYWRTRNLWPLIFAHALLDLSSISLVKLLYG